jgi:hypothetical protein
MPNYFTTRYGNDLILIENGIRFNRFPIQLWYRMNESRKEWEVGRSFGLSARHTKRQMRDERGRSEVYDGRDEKSACLHYPRRGVNKYMHKREIDARLGEIGWGKEKNEPKLCAWRCRLVHKLPKLWRKGEDGNRNAQCF